MEVVCLIVVNPLVRPFMQLTPKKCDVQMSIYLSILKARPEWTRHAQNIESWDIPVYLSIFSLRICFWKELSLPQFKPLFKAPMKIK